IPSEYSSLLGLYTQQVVAHESRVTQAVDPLGGSYYVEAATDRILSGVRDTLTDVERRGGAIAAIEDGTMQRAITDAAYAYQLDEESGRRVVVGVNTPGSKPPTDPDFALHEHDDATLTAKRDQLRHHRAARSAMEVDATLAQLGAVLQGTENCIPAVRGALRAGATVGEIMATCVVRYGEYEEPAG
ncbi:MAG TPA: methylmalonyl-CoA mutase family protein, partial [Acidimicrobiales bacterium]|nr:methylmalonyl-CoA mutase family protein [Acidimicrobiales bacterium]